MFQRHGRVVCSTVLYAKDARSRSIVTQPFAGGAACGVTAEDFGDGVAQRSGQIRAKAGIGQA